MKNKYKYSISVTNDIDKTFYMEYNNLRLSEFKELILLVKEMYSEWDYTIISKKELINPPPKVVSTWKCRRELGSLRD